MVLLLNKKAKHEYEILKMYHAGVVLLGSEVKSLRNKSGSLTGSFVKIIGNEAFLVGAQITPYAFADTREYDPKRTRKLLLKRTEIHALLEATQQKGTTLVPLSLETVGRHIKLRFGVGRGLKQFEKREKIKKRDQERELQRAKKRWG